VLVRAALAPRMPRHGHRSAPQDVLADYSDVRVGPEEAATLWVSRPVAPTQAALRTLEWVGRRENLVLCGPSGTGKTFLLEALGQQAVEAGLKVAWFTLENLGVLLRRHRADDTVSKAIARVLRADLVVIDLCRHRDYAEGRPSWLSVA